MDVLANLACAAPKAVQAASVSTTVDAGSCCIDCIRLKADVARLTRCLEESESRNDALMLMASHSVHARQTDAAAAAAVARYNEQGRQGSSSAGGSRGQGPANGVAQGDRSSTDADWEHDDWCVKKKPSNSVCVCVYTIWLSRALALMCFECRLAALQIHCSCTKLPRTRAVLGF